MSKFGCIDFSNDNIILSKEDLEKTKINKVFLEPLSYLKVEGYRIHILSEPSNITNKVWQRIEQELLQRNILYIASDDDLPHAFEQIEVSKGEDVKVLLAPYILRYIFKYGLARKDEKYAKIGIMGGRINTTLDVLIPIVDEVTDMTIFTDEPIIYREIIKEIYKKTRIRIKLMYPNPKVVHDMDIIYDVNEKRSYWNWADVKAIYIDFFSSAKTKEELKDLPLSIWYDFDIICERHPVEKSTLEALLYSEGFTRHILRKKIKNFDIRISRVYTLPKS